MLLRRLPRGLIQLYEFASVLVACSGIILPRLMVDEARTSVIAVAGRFQGSLSDMPVRKLQAEEIVNLNNS